MAKDGKIKFNLVMITLGAILIYLVPILILQVIIDYNDNNKIIDFSNNWNCSVDGKKLNEQCDIDNEFNNLKKDAEIVFSKKLLNNNELVYPTMCIKYMWCDIEVYYDGKRVFKNKFMYSLSSVIENEIDISDYQAGKEVEIRLRPTNIKQGSYIKGIQLIEGHDVVGYKLRQNLIIYVIGGLIGLFGVAVCIIALLSNNRTKEIKKLFWLGATFLLLSLLIISKKNVLVLVVVVLLILQLKKMIGVDRVFNIDSFIVFGIIACIIVCYVMFDYTIFAKVYNNGVFMIGTIILLHSLLYCSDSIKQYLDSSSTEKKEFESIAYVDPLTGVMNRTKYEEVIGELSKNNNTMCTVISFDLNNLKKINDKYGHEAGDEYIKSFAKVIRKGFGKEGLIARIGGDEFVVIIRDKSINIDGILDAMQGLLKITMKKYYEFETSFAYGIAHREENEDISIMQLIKKSDQGMYECKRNQKQGRDDR